MLLLLSREGLDHCTRDVFSVYLRLKHPQNPSLAPRALIKANVQQGGTSPPWGLWLFGLFALGAALPWLGCASAPAATATVPSWELAHAEPFEPVYLGRARVSFDRPLPSHMSQELCEEFSLVIIRDRHDWADVQRRLQLPPTPPGVDLDQGIIVGILAKVGENADGRWPIRLRSIRRRGQEGSIEATFTPGFYYPLLTADYIEFAYAPGLRILSMVRINQRQFLIRSRPGLH